MKPALPTSQICQEQQIWRPNPSWIHSPANKTNRKLFLRLLDTGRLLQQQRERNKHIKVIKDHKSSNFIQPMSPTVEVYAHMIDHGVVATFIGWRRVLLLPETHCEGFEFNPISSPEFLQLFVSGWSPGPTADKEPGKLWARD